MVTMTMSLDKQQLMARHLGGWFVDLGHPDDEATK